MWKWIRITILLLVFVTVSAEAYIEQVVTTRWEKTLKVVVYPVAAHDSPQIQQFIDELDSDDFEDVERYLESQARNYMKTGLKPVDIVLGPMVDSVPPQMPDYDGIWDNMWFSLKLRAWVEKNDPIGDLGDIRLFAVFHDPEQSSYLPHSVGLQKGLMGVVHGYADPEKMGTNNFVLTHELLHTFGATDKYDPDTNLPLYPRGYAMPNKVQLYPQNQAEIMGGRIPLDRHTAETPSSLDESIIGGFTAWEINWIR